MAVLNSLYSFYFHRRELFRPLLAFRQTSSCFWLWQNKEGHNGKGAIIFQGMYVHVLFANRRHFGSMLSEKWPLYSKNTPAPSANLPEFVLIRFAAKRNQCLSKCLFGLWEPWLSQREITSLILLIILSNEKVTLIQFHLSYSIWQKYFS